MHSIAIAVLKAGILPPETLAEFKRWGHPVEDVSADLPVGPEQVVMAIEKALQEEGLVVTRETDLEAVSDFLKTQQEGTLNIFIEADGVSEMTDFPCSFGTTPLGEYIIRYHSESIEDLMTNGVTYLSFNGKDGKEGKVYFNRVRELFFGAQKAFMICTPVSRIHG